MASKVTRKLVKSKSGEEAFAFSDMVGHMSALRDLFAHFLDPSPCLVDPEDCGSLLTHLKNKKITTEKFPVRHFLAAELALETQELDNA